MTGLGALVLIVLIALSGYAAGRLHGQIGYRLGYRFGYRQGYFDGDRSSWNRRRREMQAALAAVISTPVAQRPEAYPTRRPVGTTYTSHTHDETNAGTNSATNGATNSATIDDTDAAGTRTAGRHARAEWVLADAGGPG
jgi:hypothetical protein